MKIIFALIFLFVSATMAAQNNKMQDTAATPAITAIGKPDGEIAEIKIGKEGGSLTSSDGKIELTIPEGAISKKTNFSIQPITNMVPNANGKAYRLEPSGIQFQQPVQIAFHYTEDESADSMQLLLGIAMQGNNGQWYNLTKFILDTLAKTLTGTISHFSDWAKFDRIKLEPSNARVKIKKSLSLFIVGVIPKPKDDGEDLSPLFNIVEPAKLIWKVNDVVGGNGSFGTIKSVAGSIERILENGHFVAPDAVPATRNPVAVTVDLKGLSFTFNKTTFKNLKLVSNILIYDNAYEVTIISSANGMAGSQLGNVTYKDTGSFVVSLNGKDSKIIEKVNKNSDDKLDYKGKCIITLLKAGTGNVHIIGASSIQVIPPASSGGNAWVDIQFKRAPTILSLLQAKCPPVGKGDWTTATNAQANAMVAGMPAFPQRIKFEAKEGEQTQVIGEEGGLVYVKYTIRQLKDD